MLFLDRFIYKHHNAWRLQCCKEGGGGWAWYVFFFIYSFTNTDTIYFIGSTMNATTLGVTMLQGA